MAIVFLSSLVMTAVLIHILRRSRIGQFFLDIPTARGLHTTPVPRVGGIAIFASVWILSAFWLQKDLIAVASGLSLVLLCISLLDDLRPLPALLRLLVHAAVAIAIVLIWANALSLPANVASTSGRWVTSAPGTIACALAIVWMTNLYNFMDGADGLAGGMSLIGFSAYAAALAMAPGPAGSLAPLVTTLAGAAAGFLLFNFPPAKVFMGDAGAIPMGFLAITLGIYGNMLGHWPWWFAGLVFSPFIVDATATLMRRTLQGRKPWIAHRDNYYQRLILAGWSQRRTAIVYYLFMLAATASALNEMHSPNAHAILLAWVITYALLLLLLEWRLHEKKNNKSKNNDREAT